MAFRDSRPGTSLKSIESVYDDQNFVWAENEGLIRKKNHEQTPPEDYAATGHQHHPEDPSPRAPRKGPTESKRPLREVPAAATCTIHGRCENICCL